MSHLFEDDRVPMVRLTAFGSMVSFGAAAITLVAASADTTRLLIFVWVVFGLMVPWFVLLPDIWAKRQPQLSAANQIVVWSMLPMIGLLPLGAFASWPALGTMAVYAGLIGAMHIARSMWHRQHAAPATKATARLRIAAMIYVGIVVSAAPTLVLTFNMTPEASALWTFLGGVGLFFIYGAGIATSVLDWSGFGTDVDEADRTSGSEL